MSRTIPRTQATALGVMLAGVALVCLTWILLGLDVARQLTIFETRARDAQRRVALTANLSSAIRVQILVGSVALRDLLLEADPEARQDARRQILEAESGASHALAEYAEVTKTPNEVAVLQRLRDEARDYWRTLARAVSPRAQSLQGDALRQLQTDIVQRRRALLRLVDQIEAEVQGATLQQQEELAVLHGSARRHLWWGGALALLLSTGIASVGARRIRALEQALERQHHEDARKTKDLQRLSGRLMTVQDDERRSISRELHDELGQALTALKLELGIVQRQLDSGAPVARALEPARAMADRTLEDLRNLSRLLHPAVLDDFGLASSLELYLGAFQARTGIAARLECELSDVRFPPEVETCIYRSVQEALTNIVRHADASRCAVALAYEHGVLSVSIEDDGRGFAADDPATSRQGLGLVGLGERATMLGGTLRIESRVDGGTRLCVRVPAQAVAQHDAEPERRPASA